MFQSVRLCCFNLRLIGTRLRELVVKCGSTPGVFVTIQECIFCFQVHDTLSDIFVLQVAASRVKARQRSAGLAGLQGASRNGMLTSAYTLTR